MHRILLLALFVTPLPAQQITLQVPLQPGPNPELIAVVTFDAHRVSAEDLKRWMRLHETSYYDTVFLGHYADCNPSDIARLEKDIEKTQQVVDDLDPRKYPPELAGVVQYLKELQSFWLWLAQQELAFLKSGKLPSTEYNGVGICRARNFMDKRRACRDLFYYWHSCAVDVAGKKLGDYPKEKWKAFLEAYGIQEKLGSAVPD